MGVPTAVHQQALREAKEARNAHARRRRSATSHALEWCEQWGAKVDVQRRADGNVLYTVKLKGFSPSTHIRLEWAVDALRRTADAWCAGRATHGPTGASLEPLRARRRALVEAERKGA